MEILSRSNTAAEMAAKRQDYFAAGVRLVWEIEPELRSARVYTDPDTFTTVPETGTLDGGAVLPGFSLPLADLFARLERKTNP